MTDALFISALVSSLWIKVDNMHPRGEEDAFAVPSPWLLA